MIFDKLCGIVERHAPTLRRYLVKARIFDFPGKAHEVLPKRLDNADWFMDNFYLPFDTVAIEDLSSVIILIDTEPNMFGLYLPRLFIECMPMRKLGREYTTADKQFEPLLDLYEEEWKEKYKDQQIYFVSHGLISFEGNEETRFLINGQMIFSLICTMNELSGIQDIFDLDNPMHKAVRDSSLRNAASAIEEVIYFNSPDRFVMEVSSAKAKRNKDSKKILRSGDRPIYHLLYPNEIRKYIKSPESHSDRKSPKPHERRKHIRVLRSERFVHKKGERIIIPATWIGPSESVIGNRRYKIMLDI